ncbi:hypothetical protein THMIRHAS_09200 [Thiosulfatimonas sediminis]|uniref:Flagellar protein FliL n=1 Tax=Thiosulfatimonas sediminis TaxID=2675054 RepID=A0A6F8PU41_9GAMM|nr:flagellar basal body-associated FliL family protein [Thiosulfatimonas sediminis]BBP45547.1 hypothetical protein THMIRHAS_09200 [Thiosulfatimonas sediminis]
MAEEEVKEEKKKGGKGLIILLLVIVILLLVGIGVMAYLLLSQQGASHANGDAAEVHGSAEHGEHGDAADAGHAKNYSPKYKQYEPPSPEAPPGYFVMDKFVVNFNGDGQAKYLAVDLQFLTYYPQLIADMEHLRPILKNDIQRLLRNQHFNQLSKPEGPDELRAELLQVARHVLEANSIYPELLEDVYMTRFVMQ